MPRPLTFEERLAVTLSLKGERLTHRRWPREAVEAFAKGKVAASSRPHALTRVHRRLFTVVASIMPRRIAGLYSDRW